MVSICWRSYQRDFGAKHMSVALKARYWPCVRYCLRLIVKITRRDTPVNVYGDAPCVPPCCAQAWLCAEVAHSWRRRKKYAYSASPRTSQLSISHREHHPEPRFAAHHTVVGFRRLFQRVNLVHRPHSV